MPRTGTEVRHASVTDHRVLRHAEGPTPSAALHPTAAPTDLVPFHRGRVDWEDDEIARGLGLAIIRMRNRRMPQYYERQYAAQALPLLDRALAKDPHDWPVLLGRCEALACLDRKEESLAAAKELLAARPECEEGLHWAGFVTLALNRPTEARTYYERAIRVNPGSRDYHLGLAAAFFRLVQWERSAEECRQALRIEPSDSQVHSLLLQCYLCLGRKDAADAEYDKLRHLTRANRQAALREWYEGEVRRLAR
jgi:tetratricopeptide (TPR) repeat protein